jgi:hypothetical protein
MSLDLVVVVEVVLILVRVLYHFIQTLRMVLQAVAVSQVHQLQAVVEVLEVLVAMVRQERVV